MVELNQEEKDLLKLLGLALPKESTCSQASFQETKIVKGIVHCALCGTKFEEYIRLRHVDKHTWRKEEYLTLEDLVGVRITSANTVTTTVRSCIHCYEVLIEKSREDLVKMLISLGAPITNVKIVLGYLAEIQNIKPES